MSRRKRGSTYHGCVLDKVFAGLLFSRGVVYQGTRCHELRVRLCSAIVCQRTRLDPRKDNGHLMLHALEGADQLTELLTVVPDVSAVAALAKIDQD
jgi:hypothetical protein